MTSDVYCPKCGRKLLVDWNFEGATSTSCHEDIVQYEMTLFRMLYVHEYKCPLCGAELEISYTLVPHFVAELAR